LVILWQGSRIRSKWSDWSPKMAEKRTTFWNCKLFLDLLFRVRAHQRCLCCCIQSTTVLWDTMPWSSVHAHHHFRVVFCLHLHDAFFVTLLLYDANGDYSFAPNVRTLSAKLHGLLSWKTASFTVTTAKKLKSSRTATKSIEEVQNRMRIHLTGSSSGRAICESAHLLFHDCSGTLYYRMQGEGGGGFTKTDECREIKKQNNNNALRCTFSYCVNIYEQTEQDEQFL
jgi:hypothetical protein